ncbi:methionyl-tRNA formyltransferase [Treponema sp. Marseille-Q4523]|uniref:methionyl-tRNA formyltransferase n=1 Tax=Treponema sp. Marseille-Q4523 TaxID=2810610 RepID=UPI00196152B5|nr:methionyl-tRNA formyltransferase [Treponema sp. Marseille-Q4523]MBM7022518.1 methionyl-tRNA formyltransferase [Treponema sp. Marseille-Q4523]
MIRVLYAGSPEASAKTLSLLFDGAGAYEIAGVLSNPPSAQGRHKTPAATAVARFAEERGIPLFTPERLNAASREEIASIRPDILVCFAYGHIFGPKFLSLFPLGAVNLHPSLLPKYRGPAPVNAAILNRDTKTAVTVQTISLAMDEGDILAQEIVALDGSETAGSLLDHCAVRGAEIIKKLLGECASNGKLSEGKKQAGEASYTKIITKDDCRIDWMKSAAEIDAKIRAYFPEPGAWTEENGSPLRILSARAVEDEKPPMTKAAVSSEVPGTVLSFDKKRGILVQTGSGILAVTELQRQGKKALGAQSFINGARNFVGTVLR